MSSVFSVALWGLGFLQRSIGDDDIDDKTLNAILRDPSGHRFAVIGLGEESGVSAANFLQSRGARVRVTELRAKKEVASALGRLHRGIEVETGGHGSDLYKACEVAIAAPGIPQEAEVIVGLRNHGIPILGETELAAWHLQGKIVGVTGTKGKSTTSTLLALGAEGRFSKAWTGGNISPPALDLVDKAGADDLVVLELSSFQLALTQSLKLDVAVVTNFGEDHLDRYGDVAAYRKDKLRITRLQDDRGTLVLPWKDRATEPFGALARGRKIYFGTDEDIPEGVVVNKDHFAVRQEGREQRFPIPRTPFFALPHNCLNTAAALSALLPLGVPPGAALEGMRAFLGLPSRTESLGNFRGLDFVNDSLGTNPKAMEAALRAGKAPVRLLAGGIFKGGDLEGMRDLVGHRLAGLYAFGRDGEVFARAWAHVKEGGTFKTMDEAFNAACSQARPGDELLLSPGCASFDQFRSAKARAERFRTLVNQWAEQGQEGDTATGGQGDMATGRGGEAR